MQSSAHIFKILDFATLSFTVYSHFHNVYLLSIKEDINKICIIGLNQ